MPIVQHDPERPNAVISIDQGDTARLVVEPFDFPGGRCAGGTVDLTPFQGGPFRLYLEADGSLNTDLYRDHYWLLAEAILPERQYESRSTGQVDENGQPITIMVEVPLNLNDIEIIVFPLPEVI